MKQVSKWKIYPSIQHVIKGLKKVLCNKITVADAISELNKKIRSSTKMKDQEYDFFYEDKGDTEYCYPGTNILKK